MFNAMQDIDMLDSTSCFIFVRKNTRDDTKYKKYTVTVNFS